MVKFALFKKYAKARFKSMGKNEAYLEGVDSTLKIMATLWGGNDENLTRKERQERINASTIVWLKDYRKKIKSEFNSVMKQAGGDPYKVAALILGMEEGLQQGKNRAGKEMLGLSILMPGSLGGMGGFKLLRTLAGSAIKKGGQIFSRQAITAMASKSREFFTRQMSSLRDKWGSWRGTKGAPIKPDWNLSPGFYRANTKDLRFTQSDASPFFNDGRKLDDLIQKLYSKQITPEMVGDRPIQVVNYNGKLFSLDNRRLTAFKHSQIENIPIELVSINKNDVAARFARRFDPIDGEGTQIVLATTRQRKEAQKLLLSMGKIKGIQLK